MEQQDIFETKLREAARKAETQDFPAMENVWNRVTEKLDGTERKRPVIWWKRLVVAASILLCGVIAYEFVDTRPMPRYPSPASTQPVVEEPAPKAPSSEAPVPSAPVTPPSTLAPQHATDAEVYAPQSESDTNTEIAAADEPALAKEKAVTKDMTPFLSNSASSLSTPSMTANRFPVTVDSTQQAVMGEKRVLDLVEGTSGDTYSGVVNDDSGLPLPGVSIVVQGTNRGTQTDLDGKFTIKAKKGERLVFSFIGLDTQRITLGKPKDFLSISLKASAKLLEAVMVQGYNITRTKKSLAASTVTVSSSYVERKAAKKRSRKNRKTAQVTSNANTLLVKILKEKTAADTLNEAHAVLWQRALSSDKRGAPLYLLDGVPVSPEKLKVLTSDDIDDVEAMNRDEALKVYGKKAENGVIMIESVTYNGDKKSKREVRKWLRELQQKQRDTQEEYPPLIENPFESARNHPLSTFSIDVDNAAYTNVRRFINQGQAVPPDAVRIEEMVNFFDYQYAPPVTKDPLAVHAEYADCPWNSRHKLLRIGLQAASLPSDRLPASNLVFLIDVSGSMDSPDKLPLLKESFKVLVNRLRHQDRVAIVVYAGAAGVVLPSTPGDEKDTILNALNKLSTGGSTAGGQGIELAYDIASEHFIKGGNNRVILATDGDFNVGPSSDQDMEELIEEKRQSGVFLTCLGFGMGNYKDAKMQVLAQKGNGNHAYIDNLQEANRFLGKEFTGTMYAVAKDVKLQVEFNPTHVNAYRLIGYETRKLRDEDFRNDAIDAGELGNGQTVTAFYEIIPPGVESTFFDGDIPLKYTKTTYDGGSELATVKFRYKQPNGNKSRELAVPISDTPVPLDRSTDDFRFAAAVAWFGLKLRDSQFIENKSQDDIEALARGALTPDPDGYRAEFVRLVELAQ
ncbi:MULTISPECIES: VWA domain-containing protein [unclassified Flavobacterium]|uniref:vWA domain-containing protein n=1 Tax=unclassified Flavobacterium TaxID=196869 RepID=UPI001F14264D|nr:MULTISPECIES: VWA domain-containing protein [unclassified Flavobacterium]UMY65690.1 von Willebrand factor type A domain-containing protein [Flavobacterium sp. HJ-32-4]